MSGSETEEAQLDSVNNVKDALSHYSIAHVLSATDLLKITFIYHNKFITVVYQYDNNNCQCQ